MEAPAKLITIEMVHDKGEVFYPNVYSMAIKNDNLIIRGIDYDCEEYKAEVPVKMFSYIRFVES